MTAKEEFVEELREFVPGLCVEEVREKDLVLWVEMPTLPGYIARYPSRRWVLSRGSLRLNTLWLKADSVGEMRARYVDSVTCEGALKLREVRSDH